MDVRSNAYERRSLGDVCTLQRGFDLPTKNRNPGEYALVTSSGSTDTHDEAKVTGPGVVTGRSGSIGNVFFIEGDFWPLNTTLYVKDFHGNDERYVFYLLQFFNLGKFASGAGVPTLNRNHVHSEPVQVACNPEEQKRIAAVLDQAFAALDRARTHVEANLADSRLIFSSRIREVFWSATHDRRWNMATLGKLCSIKTGKKDVNEGNPEGQYPFFTCARKHTFSDIFSFEGEACLVAGNGEVGNLSYFSGKFEAYQRTYVLMDFDGILGRYLYFVLQGTLKDSLFDQRLGNTIPYIKMGMLSDFEVPVPSISEQTALVSTFEKLTTSAEELIEAYEIKVTSLNNLRQSLLQKAFSGELA